MGETDRLAGGDEETTARSPDSSRCGRCCRVVAVVVVLLLLLAAVVILAVLLLVVGQQPARVQTTCGPVEGNFDPVHKVFAFKGIPYALPPVGGRRWSAPVPLTNQSTCSEAGWTGMYTASSYPNQCKQMDPVSNTVSGSEDCLYLNVFTPSVDPSTPLPVMVYIHGGYLQWGNSSTLGYSPDEKSTGELNVVFVSIQYRLSALGFLVLEELPGRRGNYGFLDQIEALRWVRDNIASFGGDPGHVTLFGQSSGGTSTWALLMSPPARGLFHRAWLISGSPVFNKTTEEAMHDNRGFVNKTAIREACPTPTEQCLLSLSPKVVLEAMYPEWDVSIDSVDLPTRGLFEPALAVVDGTIIPEPPFDMWKNRRGNYSDIPVLIGTTAQELDCFPAPGESIKSWSKYQLETYVAEYLDPFGNNITNQTLGLYPWQHDAEYVFTTMATDVRLTCGVNEQSRLAAEALESDVYRYVITAWPSQPVSVLGFNFRAKYAFHSIDTYAFFNRFDVIVPGGGTAEDRQLVETVRDQVMSFVLHGHPRDPKWTAYPNTTALIAQRLNVTTAYQQPQCDMWRENGFFSYAWIN